MKPKAIPRKFLERPDGEIVWDSWMRKHESDLSAFQTHRDKVFQDWSSVPAIEAQFEQLFPIEYNIETRALSILQWHGSAALSTIEFLLRTYPRSDRIINLCTRMLKAVHTDAAVSRLLQLLQAPQARDAVVEHARRWPLYMLQRLLELKPNRGQAPADLVLRLLQEHPDWLEPLRQSASEDQQQTLARLLRIDEVPEAALEALPALLRSPPWRNRAVLPHVPELALTPIIEPARFHGDGLGVDSYRFESGRHEIEAAITHAASAPADAATHWSLPRQALWVIGVRPEALDAALSCRPLEAADFQPPPSRTFDILRHLYHLPPAVANHVLQHIPGNYLGFPEAYAVRPLLHWLGDALRADCVQRLLPRISRYTWSVHHRLETDRLALDMAQASRNRWQRKDALKWLCAYPLTAARGLLPTALGAAGATRDIARHALRDLHANGHAASLHQAAERYGPAASMALTEMLAVDPLQLLPHVMPSVPKSLVIATLPRVFLRDSDRAIPLPHIPDVLVALALSTSDAPYPGLLEIQREVDPSSLARFAQALLKWWHDNGAASKDRWMFAVQGLIGNDETARMLATLLRQWRAALNRVRAYDAMELLGQIGSDVALMQLHNLASQTRYADLRTRAEGMIKEVAEQRGLTIEQLEDRTVPDLGLDVDGKLTLDFGARQFSVHFDESLLPFVRDAAGKRLKDLPKPKVDDDAVAAKAAAQRYKDLKKQARSVVGLQIRRLEMAMCAGRRWSGEEFRTLLLPHPLLRHLVQRLVWGSYGTEGELMQVFRVAEDLSLADERDAACEQDPAALIGIVHPIELAEMQRCNMAQVFADYEILQPFRQLDREVYRLAAGEADTSELLEWRGRSVTIASLLGLEQRGWNRVVGDGGIIDRLAKPLAGDQSIAIDFVGDPGWFVGAPAEGAQVQEITRVGMVSAPRWGGTHGGVTLAQLSRLQASELQRDLHLMAWFVE